MKRYATKADFIAGSITTDIRYSRTPTDYITIDKVLSNSPAVPLTYERGTTTDPGVYGALQLGGIWWVPMYDTSPVNVAQWGAVADDSTDCTAAIQAAADFVGDLVVASLANLEVPNPKIVFPAGPGLGYRVTDTISIHAGVDVWMDAAIRVVKVAGTPIIGLHLTNPSNTDYEAPRHANPRIMVSRVTQSNWSSENDIGVKIDATYNAEIDLHYIAGFAVGADICAGYGAITIGEIRGFKKGIRLTGRDNPDHFSNHIRLRNGSFARDGANASAECIAIYLDGNASSGLNTIHGDGQSYEIGALGVPIVADGNVSNGIFTNQRWEHLDAEFLRIDGTSRQIHAELIYADDPSDHPESSLLVDNSPHQSSHVTRMAGVSNPVWRHLVYDTGLLKNRVLASSGGYISIVDMEVAVNAGAAGGGNQPIVWADAGPTVAADGYVTASGPLYGVQIELDGCRALTISGSKKASTSMSVAIICYDSSGNQLTTGTDVSDDSASGYSGTSYNSSAYRGYYTTSPNPNTDAGNWFSAKIGFAATVSRVFIAMGSATKGWKIHARDPRPRRVTTSHQMPPGAFLCNGIPNASPEANTSYYVGQTAWRVTAVSGSTFTWTYTSGGWKAGYSLA